MILADKIMCLRKKKGWSQEELANRMNVSRQSVSKWENESAVPEIEKIVLLSNVFNVTTDYLLQEDLNEDCNGKEEVDLPKSENAILSSQEVDMYFKESSKSSRYTATGVSLIILGVTILTLTSVVPLNPLFDISSTLALVIGLVFMFFLTVNAIRIFAKGFISKTIIKYGVRDCISYLCESDKKMVEERKEKYKETYRRGIIISVTLLIVGIFPLLIGGIYSISKTNMILLIALFLVTSNFSIHILMRVSINARIFGMLLNSK